MGVKAPASAAELHRALIALRRIQDPLERRLPLIELLEAASRNDLAPEDMFTGAKNGPVVDREAFQAQPAQVLIVLCDDLGRGKVFALPEAAINSSVQETLDLADGVELLNAADCKPAVATAVLRLLSAMEMGVGESYDRYEQWIEAYPGGAELLSEDEFDAAHQQIPLKALSSKDELDKRFVRIVSVHLIREE